MQEWLINLGTDHAYWVYAFIIVLACAEGPMLSMIFGVILKLGYFSFIPIMLSLMIGDLIGDVVWYYIGYRFGHRFIGRFGKYFSITEENIGKVTRIFHKYKHRILLISKMSNGFGFALVTLMAAGMARIPFINYISINVIGQFVWTGFLLGVGYFFGNLYLQVDSILGKMAVVALFAIIFWAFKGYKKYLRTKAEALNI